MFVRLIVPSIMEQLRGIKAIFDLYANAVQKCNTAKQLPRNELSAIANNIREFGSYIEG